MKLKTVCFICSEYPPGPHGGVGTMTQITARALVQKGFEVRVTGVYPEDYLAANYEDDQGVKVWRIKTKKGKYAWITGWRKQYSLIKKWDSNNEIDIVEAPDSRGWFAFWGKLSCKLVLRANGSTTYFSKILNQKVNKLTYVLEKLSYGRADSYTAVSDFTAKKTTEIFKLEKKYTVIYNAIEERVSFSKSEIQQNKIVFAGSLVEKKGILNLIHALNNIVNKNSEIIVEIYGKDTFNRERGSMVKFLESIVSPALKERLKIINHVPREKLFEAYSTANVAIFPSYAEAFAFAPMEAMLMGCPTIYTTRGSGPELIKNNVDGLLVDPDNIEEIAKAIEYLCVNLDRASEMGEKGRDKILEKFTINKMIDQLINYYESVLNQ